jgi:deoxyribodipyrimidine photo-lyase
LIEEFEQGALRDTVLRTGLEATDFRAGVPSDLARWASRAGATQIVTPYIPTGPLRDWMLDAKRDLDDAGINLVEWRRDWDGAIWPYATAGFFKVRKQIPVILQDIGLT